MSHVIQPGASMHGIALRHDFQQSPVGSLAGRGVQQAQAQAPRSLGRVLSDVGRGIQGLASRALNAVTPHGVRADSKFRAGLKETGAQVGELLGALSHGKGHQVDGAAAQRVLRGLGAAAEPLTSRGLPYGKAIEQRAAVHLAKMTPAQRQALHTGLAMAQNSALKDDPTLAAVSRAMEQRAVEQGVPALQQGLDLAIAMVAQEAQDKGVTGRAFDELYNTAREVLTVQGFGGLPADELKHLQRALVLQALDQRLDTDDMPSFIATATLINQLPSRELHALMHEERTLAGADIFNAPTAVMGAIGRRADVLEQQLGASLGALLARSSPAEDDPAGILHAPQSFARDVADAGQALADLRQHCELHDMHFPPALAEAHARTLDHLERYLDNPTHLAQLPELSAAQLHGMQRGLQQIGVEAGQAEMTADAARRREAALDDHAQVLAPGLQALAQGQLPQALDALAGAQARADAALSVHMALGLKVEGADEIMDLRDRLIGHALGRLDDAALQALSARLHSPQAEALMDALGEAASALLSGGSSLQDVDEDAGRALYTRSTDLMLLRSQVDSQLQQRGLAAPPPAWAGELDAAQVIRAQYGVAMNPGGGVNVHAGRAGPAMQEAVQGNVEGMVARPDSLPRHAQFPQVSSAFMADLPRARYAITDAGGSQPLFDPQAPDRDGATRSAIAQLQQLAGGNDELVLLASRLAHQGSLAGLQEALLTPQGLLRLPDGTPGRLMGTERVDYGFASDGEGGLLLRVNYDVQDATHFLPAPRSASEGIGSPVELDAQRSNSQFNFTLHIGADLSVRVSEPVQYRYDAQRAA